MGSARFLAAGLAALSLAAVAGPQVARDGAGIEWRIGVSEDGDDAAIIERRLPNQAVDPAFGRNGRASARIGTDADAPAALRVDSQGRIWVGGTAEDVGSPQPVIVRLLPDGSADPSWGRRGRSAVSPSRNASWLYDMLPMPDGSVIVAGDTENPDGDDRASLWRLMPDGSLDASFFPGGQWLRPGNDGARAVSLAAADARVIGLAAVVMEGADPWVEIYDNRGGPSTFALVQRERVLSDRSGEYHLRWEGGRWRVFGGREVAELKGAAPLSTAPVALAPSATTSASPEPAGHAGLSPFAVEADAAASAPAAEEGSSTYMWAALAGALVAAVGWFAFNRRDAHGRIR